MAVACAAILLTGCGLTGELYLPEDAESDTDAQTDSAEEDESDTEADEE